MPGVRRLSNREVRAWGGGGRASWMGSREEKEDTFKKREGFPKDASPRLSFE